MNRTELLKRAGNILLKNPALMIVTLVGLIVSTAASGFLINQTPGVVALRVLLIFLVVAFTRGALISMVNANVDEQPLTLGQGIQSGFRWLASLLLIELALMIPVWIVIFVASGSLLTTFLIDLGQPDGLQASSILNYIGAILSLAGLALVLNIALSALGIGVERAIVIDKKSISEALKEGLQLLRSKYLDFIVFAGILFMIGIGVSLVLSLAGQQVLSSMGIDLTDPNLKTDPIILFSSPLGVVLLGVQIIATTALTILASIVWTLVYRQWHAPEIIEAPETKADKKRALKSGE